MPALRSLGAVLLFGATAAQVPADGRPEVPADYPSHDKVGSCHQEGLSRRLQHYNETRLDLADVLRHLAEDRATTEKAKTQLVGYAANLDNMRRELPPPDPDTNDFQNFDFQLGITLTSITLFFNTEDEHLMQRFASDRDNPDSQLGIYLARLEDSRRQYMDRLAASMMAHCRG